MPPLTGVSQTNFPLDILFDAGVVYAGANPIGGTKGAPKWTPNRTTENIAFDGKHSPVKGLDRVVHGEPSLAFTMLEIGPVASGNQIALVEPGATNSPVTSLTAPGTITPSGSSTGGTLAAGTYYYKVSALNAAGESIASAEATSGALTGTTSSVGLVVGAVAGALSYRWYRGASAAGENVYFTTVGPTFTDIGGAGAAGTPLAAGSFTATVYTPQSSGALVAGSSYVQNLRVIWERGYKGSGAYFAVRFPWAFCSKYDIAGQDKKEGLIAVEFMGRIDLATMQLTDPPYVLEYRNALPVI